MRPALARLLLQVAPAFSAAQIQVRRWQAALGWPKRLPRRPTREADLHSIEWKKILAICILTGVVTPLLLLVFARPRPQSAPLPKSWNSDAIKSTFIEMKIEQIDRKSAALIFYYYVMNNTNYDYQLTNGPNIQFMRRLKSDGSLAPEGHMKVSSDARVPAGNSIRIGLAINGAFAWPARMDGAAANRFRQLVVQQAKDLDGFVLLDEMTRYRIEFPGTWQIPKQMPGI